MCVCGGIQGLWSDCDRCNVEKEAVTANIDISLSCRILGPPTVYIFVDLLAAHHCH